jgi:hypothetical protein
MNPPPTVWIRCGFRCEQEVQRFKLQIGVDFRTLFVHFTFDRYNDIQYDRLREGRGTFRGGDRAR